MGINNNALFVDAPVIQDPPSMGRIVDDMALEPTAKPMFPQNKPLIEPITKPNKSIPKKISTKTSIYGDIHTLNVGIKKVGEKTDKFIPTEVRTPPKRLQESINSTYKNNPDIPKGLLEAILMKESAMGSMTNQRNTDIGQFAYLTGFGKNAKAELIRNGIVPELNTHAGVLQATADYYKLKKDLKDEKGNVKHTYDNMTKWYNERYSSGKLKPEDIEKFEHMFDYYSSKKSLFTNAR